MPRTLICGNQIANGMLAPLTHPEQRQLLQYDPALIKTAVEEFLRYDGPVETSTMRFAREDVERGERVLVILDSAHRDERQFENPDDQYPPGTPAPGTPAQSCAGRRAVGLHYRASMLIRGLQRLPVRDS